jgi:transcriptional regulator with XRE-family HTH domain
MGRAGSECVAERFGENLRRVRHREGLSQEHLAMRASLHRTEVGRLEAGERVCRIDTLIRLAGAMAVLPGELLEGIDWVPGRRPRAPSPSAPVPGRTGAIGDTDETDLDTDQSKRDRARSTNGYEKATSAKP